MPVLLDYSEDTFGPDFLPTEADYTDPDVVKTIDTHGWMIWPLVPYSYDTIVKNLTPPHRHHRPGAIRLAPTTRHATCWRG